MENRYLFRGKRKDNGKWIQGYLYGIWERNYILWGMTNDIPDMVEVDPETVCKCTELKDKNGTLIWEKDIVSFEHKKIEDVEDVLSWDFVKYIRNYVIEFQKTFVNYGLRFRNKSIHFECKQSTLCTHNCEVIGNEIDNPELLGVERGSNDGE